MCRQTIRACLLLAMACHVSMYAEALAFPACALTLLERLQLHTADLSPDLRLDLVCFRASVDRRTACTEARNLQEHLDRHTLIVVMLRVMQVHDLHSIKYILLGHQKPTACGQHRCTAWRSCRSAARCHSFPLQSTSQQHPAGRRS